MNTIRETFIELIKPHPMEKTRNVHLQEEARAERLSNLIRIVYLLVWLAATAPAAGSFRAFDNLANIGGGLLWLTLALAYQVYLSRRPYTRSLKYLSTTVDLVMVTLMLFVYQFSWGYAKPLKSLAFMNYYCVLGLVGLRFHRRLAVYSGALCLGLYVLLFTYLIAQYKVEFGMPSEHIASEKINAVYVLYHFIYLSVFTFLIFAAAHNVRRLVDLRVKESAAALLEKERGIVAASVAHEIKNPLEGIYGAAQLLKEDLLGNRRFLDIILNNAIRLNDVIHQFLQFSKHPAARLARFDVVPVLRRFCGEQNDLCGGDALALQVPEVPVYAWADPEGLQQVLLNLVQNARRYQVPGKPVQVNLDHGEGWMQVSVEDEGEGVAPEIRSKLFEPFFTTSLKGTGLGLATSKKIAKEMQGDIYFEPKNPGSKFVMVLKADPEKEAG